MKPVDLAVLCALSQELGPLADRLAVTVRRADLEILEGNVAGLEIRAVVGGVGKVAAARAASWLVEPSPRLGLVVVGVCGGLAANQPIGSLVHCSEAVQCDLHLPGRGRVAADADLGELWRRVAPAASARFLTADRAAMTPWRRFGRRLRHGPGDCVADMETAAAAWVAHRAGVPWAALRAVSDTQGWRRARSFAENFATQAPRAAATVVDLCGALARRSAPEDAP
ncbi:MAG: hypothetical protein R3F34_02565 [Planctomycetota bacterium]